MCRVGRGSVVGYRYNGGREQTYRILCLILVGRFDGIDYCSFSLADWEALNAVARAEGVAPLLYHVLSETGQSDVMPGYLYDKLRSAYHTTAAHNLLINQELVRVLVALSEHRSPALGEIPVVVLKGAALASTVYPSIALRPLSDLDLLILQRDFDGALWYPSSVNNALHSFQDDAL